jgi:hypothetical protein
MSDFNDRDSYCLQCYDKRYLHNVDGCQVVGCKCVVSNPNFLPVSKGQSKDNPML